MEFLTIFGKKEQKTPLLTRSKVKVFDQNIICIFIYDIAKDFLSITKLYVTLTHTLIDTIFLLIYNILNGRILNPKISKNG